MEAIESRAPTRRVLYFIPLWRPDKSELLPRNKLEISAVTITFRQELQHGTEYDLHCNFV